MGWYAEHIVPRLVDCACGNPGLDRWRSDTAEGLSGVVVEIGFGSGKNIPFYPSSVTKVLAVEPSSLAQRIAEKRLVRSAVPIEHIGLDGQAIPLGEASCDSALVTFTLCTVPSPEQALRELHRVLKPGGTIHFLEHGISPDPSVAKWQQRIDPFERRIADGCELTRDANALVESAGFEVVSLTQRYGKGPKPWSYFTQGVGVKVSPTL